LLYDTAKRLTARLDWTDVHCGFDGVARSAAVLGDATARRRFRVHPKRPKEIERASRRTLAAPLRFNVRVTEGE